MTLRSRATSEIIFALSSLTPLTCVGPKLPRRQLVCFHRAIASTRNSKSLNTSVHISPAYLRTAHARETNHRVFPAPRILTSVLVLYTFALRDFLFLSLSPVVLWDFWLMSSRLVGFEVRIQLPFASPESSPSAVVNGVRVSQESSPRCIFCF